MTITPTRPLSLGVEFGSTRIKAVLLDGQQNLIANGSFEWENQYQNGFWTYALSDVWTGLQAAYKEVAQSYLDKTGQVLSQLDTIGISAMMHGYLAFDKEGQLLTPFRTWRNTTTGQAAQALSQALAFNIPERWSIAHLYQAYLNQEDHLGQVDFLTTLAGYVHWQLTGEKVLGIGDGAGMFPIDSQSLDYDQDKLDKAQALFQGHLPKPLKDLLPRVLPAGQKAGQLTQAGALLLDPTGQLQPGAVFAPAEGDAGTGMVATNAIGPRTGNISAGTSIFAMVVLEKALSSYYPEIDMVTTPTGYPVAMVHANNCSSEINAWVKVFQEYNQVMGFQLSTDQVYQQVFQAALAASADAGGLVAIPYTSGEQITKIEKGYPLLVRSGDSDLTLGKVFRAQLNAAFATVSMGMELLAKEEVALDSMVGHGGIFSTPGVAQQILADALNSPVALMTTASQGGAWGIALLADYLHHADQMSLEAYLQEKIFKDQERTVLDPSPQGVAGFQSYLAHFKEALALQATAQTFENL